MFAEYTTQSSEETIELGRRLALRLKAGDSVLLFGDLGSGKTHFIKGLAQGLGVLMTIKSPTYAYVNRLHIPIGDPMGDPIGAPTERAKVFYHYDLYRMEEGGDFASIGFEESLSDPNAIHAIEWADRLNNHFPQRFVSVSLSGSENQRQIRMEFFSPTLVPESSIEGYLEEWATPKNVQQHSHRVAEVAMVLAQAHIRKGTIVNLNLLYVSCMLHDMARVCDFRHLDRSKYKEPIPEVLWQKWLHLRDLHKGKDHSTIAAEQLASQGYVDTAEAIRLHQAASIVLEPQVYDTPEKKILYYADKRVMHDHVVGVRERFKDGRERYGDGDTSEQKKLYRDVELCTLALEKELFEGLDIKPKDIK